MQKHIALLFECIELPIMGTFDISNAAPQVTACRDIEEVCDVRSFQITFRLAYFIFRIIDISNFFAIPLEFDICVFDCTPIPCPPFMKMQR